MRLFSLIGVSDRAGSGIQKVWSTWEDYFNLEPSYIEMHAPASVVLHLPIPMLDKSVVSTPQKDSDVKNKGIEKSKSHTVDIGSLLSKEKHILSNSRYVIWRHLDSLTTSR